MFPDLRSLLLFIRAVESGSLSRAAERSHIALAALSRRMSVLEQMYDTEFLYRRPSGVHVTPAGQALIHHARIILDQVGRLRADLADFSQGVRGHVRIHAATSVISQYLPEDLAQFSRLCPDVKLELEEKRSDAVVQGIRDGLADIGIVIADGMLDGLQTFEYRRDRLVALVQDAFPIEAPAVSFVELLDFDFVGLDSSAAITRLISRVADEEGRTLRLRMQVHSFEAVSGLVAVGMGIGVLPESPARKAANTIGLRVIALSDEWAERRMVVCVRDVADLSVVARRLVDLLIRDEAAPEPGNPTA